MGKVLFATIMGGFEHATNLERLLGNRLKSQGHDVKFLMCDSVLPACQMLKLSRTPSDTLDYQNRPFNYCKTCVKAGRSAFADNQDEVITLSSFLTKDDLEIAQQYSLVVTLDSLSDFEFKGTRVGMHAKAGAIRYFAKRTIDKEDNFEVVLRKFLEASILGVLAIERILETHHFDALVINHGIYVPQGPIVEYAREKTHVITWNPSYRNSTYIFSHDESYHFSMITENRKVWDTLELTSSQEFKLKSYLKSRELGSGDWIKFSDSQSSVNNKMSYTRPIGYDKVFVALTSVVWDAELHYESRAFISMFDWLKATIEYFKEKPNLALIIRVHPAEILAPTKSRETVKDFISTIFPVLPANIILIDSNNETNTFSIIDAADSVLIYNTKTGIEAACRGKQVIVAGEAWIKNKGFSVDVENSADYSKILDSVSVLPARTNVDLALKYAYHFFFRRMIELNVDQSIDPALHSNENEGISSLNNNLDAVVHSILDRSVPFHATD